VTGLHYLVCLILVILPSARAGPPASRPFTADEEPEREVERLVARLGADAWAERAAAHDELVEMGAEFESILLNQRRVAKDLEIAQRLDAILAHLNEVDRTTATFVTMGFNGLPARTAFDRLFRRARTPWSCAPADLLADTARGRVTLPAARRAFWPALIDMCRVAGVRPESPARTRAVTLVRDDVGWARRPLSVVDSAPAWAAMVEGVDPPARDDGGEAFAVRVVLYADPRLHVVGWPDVPSVERALDERGQSLVSDRNPPAGPDGPAAAEGAWWAWRVRVPLQRAFVRSERIGMLEGTIRVEVAAEDVRWEIADVLKAAGEVRDVDGYAFAFKSAVAAGDGWRVTLGLDRPHRKAGSPWISGEEARYLARCVRLVDAAGRRLDCAGVEETGGQRTTEYQITFRAAAGVGAPAALAMNLPTRIESVDVPFKFADVPLP